MDNVDEQPDEVPMDAEALAAHKRQEAKKRKALAKAERKLLKQLAAAEAKKQDVRNELDRETKFGHLTSKRWEKEWTGILEAFNHSDMKLEVQVLFAKFQAMIDTKTNVIERLQNDRKIAQEYMQFDAQGHIEVIKYFKKSFEILMKSIKDMYEDETAKMMELFRQENNLHKSINLCRQNFFESILIGSNVLSSEAMHQADVSFKQASEECAASNVERREDIRDITIKKMQQLFQQMRKTVTMIRSTSMSPARLKTYAQLVKRQNLNQHLLKSGTAKYQQIHSKQMDLQRQRNHLELEGIIELQKLNEEKKFFIECFLTIRGVVNAEVEKDDRISRRFSHAAYLTIQKLKKYQTHGEHLLNMVAVCAKLETEAEKILPFAMYTTDDLAAIKCSSLKTMSKLDYFWIRVNNVAKQNAELEEEKRYLTAENQRLQELIRRYCRQETYAKSISTLGLCSRKTAIVVRQEASHMVMFQKDKVCKKC